MREFMHAPTMRANKMTPLCIKLTTSYSPYPIVGKVTIMI